MRRSDFIIKVMSGILLAAIVCYVGFYLYHSATDPLTTALAVSATTTDSAAAEGYAVRSETVLGGSATTTATVSDGVKVAAGEVIAADYKDIDDLETAAQIRSIELRIQQLSDRLNSSSANQTNDISAIIGQLAYAVQHKDFSNLDELRLDIENNVFTGGREVSQSELDELQAQLETLNQYAAYSTDITTDVSGTFASVVDGFESVKPGDLAGLTPTSLQAMFETPGKLSGNEYGKIITSIRWYFASVMDTDAAEKLSVGGTAEVQFTRTYNAELTMQVESIGTDENGRCVVVFSCTHGLSDVCTIRNLSANVVFNSYTGIRVPKEAVHVDEDGESFVYILTGLQAEEVTVNILCEDGDYYIVEDGAVNGSALRQGSEIIIRADNLFDGKVVR
jgi:hypothetical protein